MEIPGLHLPPIPSSDLKRKAMRHFLMSNTMGSFECKWECNQTIVGLRLERRPREAGDYYRYPHPLYLSIIAPSLSFFPQITYQLQSEDKERLLSALQ
jgi:hypothetical protein